MSLFGDETENILNVDLNENIDKNIFPSDEENGGEETPESTVTTKVEPKKRSIRNPRPRLSVETLKSKRGLHTIENYFKDIKYLGKGHERRDLNEILKRLQHWAHRMYPNYKFDDILLNIERLGKKKQLQQHMTRYRQGLLEDEIMEQANADCEEPAVTQDEPFDEFDALLGEQIAISTLAGSKTPNSTHGNASMAFSFIESPKLNGKETNDQPLTQPPQTAKLSSEQIARIAENRRLALERLRAKREAIN